MPASDTMGVVAIDTGGTFTDLTARREDGSLVCLKVPSQPAAPHRAVLAALSAWGGEAAQVRHGSTVATNALLERRGAHTLLITTAGFEDLLRLRRQARPTLYALHPEVPAPLAAAIGIRGRLDPWGREVEPLEELDAWFDRHAAELHNAESIAVCLLHAYATADHERRVAQTLRRRLPHTPVTVSSELAPISREVERASTVAVNAYVAPVMARYLDRLAEKLGEVQLEVMGSSGGLVPASRAAAEPVRTLLSGPAGGVRGACAAGHRCGRSELLSLDMGGTSTDISVVRGELAPEDEGSLAEHALRVPLLPIETIGAGGGSIAYADQGGALRVGPRSAGAVPGPACYGHAGADAEPTVTDAHVVLGRIPSLLGGELPIDTTAAIDAVGRLATTLGTSVEATAHAIVAVAEANMARACKRVTMERGIDPRCLTLVAFGGAGGLHACGLADAVGCRDVLFPREPGVLSAAGILDAPVEASAVRTSFADESAWVEADLRRLVAGVSDEARATLGSSRNTVEVVFDCRYRGQSFTVPVLVPQPDEVTPRGLRAAFDAGHSERYGYALASDRPAELVAVRAYARAETRAPEAPSSTVEERFHGPCVVPAYSATLWLPVGWRASRLSTGDILCERTGEGLAPPDPDAEPLALEIHRQRLAAIAEEMGAALMRASFSANIKERRDFSCAVFDGEGNMLVQAAHIPVHLGSQPMSVRAAIDAIPPRPGVDIIVNDPFAGGTHLPDVTLVTPVFLPGDEAPVFYVSNRAHHADVGGATPGSMPAGAATIADEGIRIPPAELTPEVRARFSAASRTPNERAGDLLAQEAANTVGRRRLIELAGTVGLQRIQELSTALLDYSERRMRRVLAGLADGVYEYTDYLDDDGVGTEPIPVPVRVTIAGHRATVDFSAAPDAVAGPVNTVRAICISAVFYVFRCLGGEEVPANAGLLRPVQVITRRGSLCDAEPPAGVSAGNVETSQRLVDALFGALAGAAPDRIPAASCGSMNNVLLGGVDPRPGSRQGQAFVHYETIGGGAGGSPLGAGADGIHTHMTNTLNTPVEELERSFPVRIQQYSIRPGRCEPTCHGGAGVVRAYELLADAEVTVVSERRRVAPWGLGGGAGGEPGRNSLLRANGTLELLPSKVHVRLARGDVLIVETPGGGDWGS